MKKLLLLVGLLAGATHALDISFGDVQELLKFSREVGTDVLESYHLIKPPQPGQDDFFVRRMEKRLMNEFSHISDKINTMELRLSGLVQDTFERSIRIQKDNLRLNSAMNDLWQFVNQVQSLYHDFAEFARNPLSYEIYTLKNFAENTVSLGFNTLPRVLDKLYWLVVPTRESSNFQRSILTLLAKDMKDATNRACDTHQSPQQLLYNLYNTIALTQLKGYTMMQYSWTLLKLYNMGNFTEEAISLKEKYIIQTSDILRAVKKSMAVENTMSTESRQFWMCDPNKHIRERTYTELEQLFQGYIVNEVDMNVQSSCAENCAFYSYSKVYGCYKNQFCSQQRRCNGKLINCQYVDSDMTICPSAKNSPRRYEYIEYENGNVFGQKDTCNKLTVKVDSWWRWLFWHCSYCMCYCDDHNSSSDRHFNLRDVTSDVEKNKIVTGVRLRKENHIIHIQIQEGLLLPRGAVSESSVAWKPIDNYTIADENVHSGIDYHEIMWEKRAVDLDDLDSPADHLMTGLRFRLIGTHLNLEIQVTPFNFTSGRLQPEKSMWHSRDNTDAGEVLDVNGETFKAEKRTELKLENADLPTRSLSANRLSSQNNQYLQFSPTSLQKDAAQSSIPFLDLQDVETKPPVPMSGAGIYHRSSQGSGGFLALKLITYNFEPQLRSEIGTTQPVNSISNEIPTV